MLYNSFVHKMDSNYLHEFIDIDDIIDTLFNDVELEQNVKLQDQRLKHQLRYVLYNHHMKLTDNDTPLYKLQDKRIIRVPGAVILYISRAKYDNTITDQQNVSINIILQKYNLFISRVVIDNCKSGYHKCKFSFYCPYREKRCNITKNNCEFMTSDGHQLDGCVKLSHHNYDHTHELKLFVPNIFLKKTLYLHHDNSTKIRLNKMNNPIIELDKVKIMMEVLPLFGNQTCLSNCTELFLIAKDNGFHHFTVKVDEIRTMIMQSGLKRIKIDNYLVGLIEIPDVIVE